MMLGVAKTKSVFTEQKAVWSDGGYATKEKDKTPPNYCQNCGAKMNSQ